MFVYDNDCSLSEDIICPKITRFHIREQDLNEQDIIDEQGIIVGWVDILEWPEIQVQIIVYKDYVNSFNVLNVLNKYKRDFLELLEYETGMPMSIKSEDIYDKLDYWKMIIEFYDSY